MEVDGEKRGRQLKFIDWDNPDNNLFHMTAAYLEHQRSGMPVHEWPV